LTYPIHSNKNVLKKEAEKNTETEKSTDFSIVTVNCESEADTNNYRYGWMPIKLILKI
jgi:hypothetical protein